jgi:N,N-dimethylformamidase
MPLPRQPSILGYADQWSVVPGERVAFKFSADEPGEFRADVVRLINGDTNPAGPGFKEEPVDTSATGTYPARHQPIRPGSYVRVDDDGDLALGAAGAVHAFVHPTTPAKDGQAIVARWDAASETGWWVGIEDGRLTLRLGDGGVHTRIQCDASLHPSLWYSVVASWDAEGGTARVQHQAVVNSVNSAWSPAVTFQQEGSAEGRCAGGAGRAQAPTTIAGCWDAEVGVACGHYNGKIDAPKVWRRSLPPEGDRSLATADVPENGIAAWWDFAADITAEGVATDRCSDRGPAGLHGVCVNLPARGMTGWNWDGRDEHYVHAPEQYGAIHFHDDDLDDAGWDTDVELQIPDDLPSDVYALRVHKDGWTEHVPFFVRPPAGRATAKILFLFPTASYMAYANDHIVQEVPVAQTIVGHTSVVAGPDLYLAEHPELGLSTYDLHSDMSGVCYSSRRRPIITMRPGFRHATGSLWQFPADLHIIDWLNASGFDYDVATDDDLHQAGADLLRRYNVVMTGSHPEYYSQQMLDAWETYLTEGGRAMYLGANGFYWVISFHPDKPWVIEVRKAESGSRAWQARPGEYHHATTGERGGLWRARARTPQKLFGVGFTTEGFDVSSPYRPLPDWNDPAASFITAGVEDAKTIGDFGLVGGGAAGYENDRYDLLLGTPPHALLLASSDGQHSDNYPHVVEEIMFNFPGLGGTQDFQVRSDMVYFTTRNGGGVFSTGSIAWSGSLSHNGYDNNISRITRNVLERFAADEPLPQ